MYLMYIKHFYALVLTKKLGLPNLNNNTSQTYKQHSHCNIKVNKSVYIA